jgi:hypothetical protein
MIPIFVIKASFSHSLSSGIAHFDKFFPKIYQGLYISTFIMKKSKEKWGEEDEGR